MEILKYLTDKILIWFLEITSGFGKELTGEGRLEQKFWREQRSRNLRGLSLRSEQRYTSKARSG